MYRLHRPAPGTRRAFFSILILGFVLLMGMGGFVAASDKGNAPTVVKELLDKRTENSKTFLLSDGNYKCELYSGPINFVDESGTWQEIDTTLVPNTKDGGLRVKAAPFKVNLAAAGTEGFVASIEHQGAVVEMNAPLGIELGACIANGNKALYSAPGKDLTLSYEVSNEGGLKETITLQSTKAPSSFVYTLSHPGLILCQDEETDTWGFRTALEESPTLLLGGLSVWDSTVDDYGRPTYCPDAAMKVVPGKDASTIIITVPQSWLSDPAREYPVMVDPTVYPCPYWDTFVQSKNPNNAAGSDPNLWASNDTTYGKFRAFTIYTHPSGLVNGWIQHAELHLYEHAESSVRGPVRVAAMTKPWSGSSTWNSLGSYQLNYATSVDLTGAANPHWTNGLDVTNIVQKWVDGTEPNYGFCLYVEDSEVNITHGYKSIEGGSSTYPHMDITYTPYLDVNAYGANGTDQLDDTAAFQAAINAASAGGGRVFVPSGFYFVSELEIEHGNFKMWGSGTGTVLLPLTASQAYLIRIGKDNATTNNVTLCDMALTLPSQGDGVRIQGQGGTNITLTGLSFDGGADSSSTYAVNVASPAAFSDIEITDNYLWTVSAVPLNVPATTNGVTISGNYMPYEPYRADAFEGLDDYDLSIRLSEGTATGKAVVVVPSSIYSYFNNVGVAPLAKAYDGCVLSTPSSSLDSRVRDRLQELQPIKVFTVGVSSDVIAAVKHALPTATHVNIANGDMYLRAATVAAEVKAKLGTASKVVVMPSDDPIATSAVALAAKNGWPILLTPKNGPLPSATQAAFTSLGVTTALEIGTTVALPGNITVERVDGGTPPTTAWETAALVADYAATHGCSYAHVALADGNDFRDALALSASLGQNGGIMLLTDGDTVPEVTATMLKDHCAGLDVVKYANRPNLHAPDQNGCVWVPGAPRHTTYDLGSFADHSAQATLDKARLEVTTTDLAIASFGPAATLSRGYSSDRTTSTYFAPGWRFSFEASLDVSAVSQGRIDYVDAAGDSYTFLKDDNEAERWHAPLGLEASLSNAGSTYALVLHAGNTLTFDSAGRMLTEADPNGNTVTYAWSDGYLTSMTAANGQQITLTLDANHKLTQAGYATPDGTRTVAYSTSAPWTVTYFPGVTGLEHSAIYGYLADVLVGITADEFANGEDSTEAFGYSSGALDLVVFPDYDGTSNPDARAQITYDGRSATVTRYGRIYSPQEITGAEHTPVTQSFVWNASGAALTTTNPKTAGEEPQTWTYSYEPLTNYPLSETNPLGKTKSYTYNNRGNLTSETDEAGHTTTYAFPEGPKESYGFVCLAVEPDANDGYSQDAALVNTNIEYDVIGRGSCVDSSGWRFTGVGIPQGATIHRAKFVFWAYTVAGTPASVQSRLGMEATDNAGAWQVGTHEPRTATLAANYITNYAPTNWARNTLYQPVLTTAVQAVVDRPGWQSGNAMAVLWKDNGTPATNYFKVCDHYANMPAMLLIWYSYPETYDIKEDLPEQVDSPSGSETNIDYSSTGDPESVTSTLSATAEASTELAYSEAPVSGINHPLTAETNQIDDTSSAVTNYESGYWPNGEPKQIVYRDVELFAGQGLENAPDLVVSQVYDALGNMLSTTDTSGVITETNTYDPAGRVLTSTGPEFTATTDSGTVDTQIVTHHLYDAWGHEVESYKTSTGDTSGIKADWCTTAYDSAGRTSQVKNWLSTDPAPSGTPSNTLTYSYDGLGNEIAEADTTVSGLPRLSVYDARGNVVAAWEGGACEADYDLAKGERTVFDALGRQMQRTPPGEGATAYTYYDNDLVHTETRSDGTCTTYSYDEAGNRTEEVTTGKGTSTFGYDKGGRCISATDWNGLATASDYDDLGRLLSVGASGQPSSQFAYNSLGWQLKIQDADGFTSAYVFDTAGRMTSDTTGGHTTATTYNGAGQVVSTTQTAENRTTTFAYDCFGQTVSETQTVGSVTVKDSVVTYDSLGRVLTNTDNVRHLTSTATYPVNEPDETVTVAGIGVTGDLISTTLTVAADGYETSRMSTIAGGVPLALSIVTRDDAKRITQVGIDTDNDSQADLDSHFTYDLAGHLIRQWGTGYAEGAASHDAYTYSTASGLKTDEDLRLLSVGGVLGGGETTTTTEGATTSTESSTTTTEGATTTTEATTTTTEGATTTTEPATTTTTEVSPLTSFVGRLVSHYTYSDSGHLATASIDITDNDDPNDAFQETYAFDEAGNLISDGVHTYVYDANRLSQTKNGEQVQTYFFFDSAQRWRTAQAPTSSETDPDRVTYAYTGDGRLADYKRYQDGSVVVHGEYSYDSVDQRTQSVVTEGGVVTTTDFTYEGLALLKLGASQAGGESWTITYLYDEYGRPYTGVYRDTTDPQNPGTPVVFALVTTDRGDVVELLDANGNAFAAYRYDAWGNPLGEGNAGTGAWSQATVAVDGDLAANIAERQPLRYAGYCYDQESGMYYLSARHYDPVTRQFLSKDLSRNDGEQSAYQYCGGDPVGATDATGLAWKKTRPERTYTSPVGHGKLKRSTHKIVYQMKPNYGGGSKVLFYRITCYIKFDWGELHGGAYKHIAFQYRFGFGHYGHSAEAFPEGDKYKVYRYSIKPLFGKGYWGEDAVFKCVREKKGWTDMIGIKYKCYSNGDIKYQKTKNGKDVTF